MMEDIIKKIEMIPISDIISTRIEVIKGKDALCPFHNDQHIGSFKIDERKNIFKCFSCGEGGNGINFIQKYDGVSYREAVLIIAKEFGIIDDPSYKGKTAKRKFIANDFNKKSGLCDIANERTLNIVYYTVSKHRELAGINMLSDKHRQYLNDRGFSDKVISKMGCFTMPENQEEVTNIFNCLNRIGICDFSGIPGFFYNRRKREWDIQRMNGIGIPVKNDQGLIVGITVRRDETNGGPRYLWLTSSFADGKKSLEKGTAATAAIAVVTPLNLTDNKNIIITEGIFKANIATEFFGCIVISVQGIGNIANIENIINGTINRFQLNKPNILIAYDADMDRNVNVFKHMVTLKEKIDTLNLKTTIITWDSKYGKGIDDLISNRNILSLRKYEFDKFKKDYQAIITKATTKDVLDKDLLSELFHERILKKVS